MRGEYRPKHLVWREGEGYPHMRGEYRNLAPIFLSLLGSPPHAWGILFSSLAVWRGSDYPHMRGEGIH